MPELDEFAALAQRERKMLATRTREGLAKCAASCGVRLDGCAPGLG
jgi:hypothetical protein